MIRIVHNIRPGLTNASTGQVFSYAYEKTTNTLKHYVLQEESNGSACHSDKLIKSFLKT